MCKKSSICIKVALTKWRSSFWTQSTQIYFCRGYWSVSDNPILYCLSTGMCVTLYNVHTLDNKYELICLFRPLHPLHAFLLKLHQCSLFKWCHVCLGAMYSECRLQKSRKEEETRVQALISSSHKRESFSWIHRYECSIADAVYLPFSVSVLSVRVNCKLNITLE